MTVLDRSEPIEIGGKTYQILFTTKALIGVESELQGGNLIVVMSDPKRVQSFSVIYTLFKHGMLAGNKGLDEAAVNKLFFATVDESGSYFYAGNKSWTAVLKCGLIKPAPEPAPKNRRAAVKNA